MLTTAPVLTTAQEEILVALHLYPELRESKYHQIATTVGYSKVTLVKALRTLEEMLLIRSSRPHERGNCLKSIEITEQGMRFIRSVQTAEVLR